MKVGTSRIVLLVLGAVFLGGMLVLALAGDESARRELPAQVAAWATVGGGGLRGLLVPRPAAPRAPSGRGAFAPSPVRRRRPAPLLRPRVRAPRARRRRQGHREHVVGPWRGMDVVVIDYWFGAVEGRLAERDPRVHVRRHHRARRVAGPLDRPGRARRGARRRRAPGHRVRGRELQPGLRGPVDDRRFAHALIDARMIAWLEGLPPDTGFELLGGTLLCRTPRVPTGTSPGRSRRWPSSWAACRR